MMKIWLMCSMLAVSMCGSARGNAYRTFTAKDGRTIEARIVGYDVVKDKLKMEFEGSTELRWVSPGAFGGMDTHYVDMWISDCLLKKPSSIKIELDKEVGATTGGRSGKQTSEVYYEMSIRNRTAHPIMVNRVEYCYYILRDDMDVKNGRRILERPGEVWVGVLEPSKAKTFDLPKIDLIQRYGRSASDNSVSGQTQKDSLMGMWVRAYGPSLNDTPSYVEFVYPGSLKRKVRWRSPRTESVEVKKDSSNKSQSGLPIPSY